MLTKKRLHHYCGYCKRGFYCHHQSKYYCSIECRNKARDEKNGIKSYEKKCLYCNKKFKTTNKNKTFCNSECYKNKRNLRFTTKLNDIREFIFERDNFKCQKCKKRFSFKELNAHHVIPIYKGGDDNVDNIITLCESCHKLEHKIKYISVVK